MTHCPICGHAWDDHTSVQHQPPVGSSAGSWVSGHCIHRTPVDLGYAHGCGCVAIRPGPPVPYREMA